MAAQNPVYRPFTKTTNDKFLFLGAFVVGAIGVLILKSVTETLWLPLLFGITIQILYFFPTYFLEAFRLREDRAGDSYYYLGFLLTLISLGHTLYAFANSERQDQLPSIISGFGIALGTTIIGLLLRVIVQQFRTDPVEVEYQARNELIEASRELKVTLYGVLADMNGFRQGLKSSIEETLESSSEIASEAMAEASGHFVERLVQALESMEKTFTDFSSSAKSLSESTTSTVEALTQLTKRIQNIEPPTNVVEVVFGPARDVMAESAKSVQQAADAQNAQLKRLAEMVALAASGADSLENRTRVLAEEVRDILGAEQQIAQFRNTLEDINAGVSKLSTSLGQTSQEVLALPGHWEKAATASNETLSGLSQDLTTSRQEAAQAAKDAVAAIQAAGDEHVSNIQSQLKRLETASDKLIGGLVTITENVSKRLEP